MKRICILLAACFAAGCASNTPTHTAFFEPNAATIARLTALAEQSKPPITFSNTAAGDLLTSCDDKRHCQAGRTPVELGPVTSITPITNLANAARSYIAVGKTTIALCYSDKQDASTTCQEFARTTPYASHEIRFVVASDGTEVVLFQPKPGSNVKPDDPAFMPYAYSFMAKFGAARAALQRHADRHANTLARTGAAATQGCSIDDGAGRVCTNSNDAVEPARESQ
jgi:hypothetical protein